MRLRDSFRLSIWPAARVAIAAPRALIDPTVDILGFYRQSLRNWEVAKLVILGGNTTTQAEHSEGRYRRAVQRMAKRFFAERKSMAVAPFSALIFGLMLFVVLVASNLHRFGETRYVFLTFLVAAFALNGIGVLNIGPTFPRPWRRMGALAVTFAAVSLGGAFFISPNGTASAFVGQGNLSLGGAFVASTAAIAAFNVYGLTLARFAYWRADRRVAKLRRSWQDDDDFAIVYTVGLIATLLETQALEDAMTIRTRLRFLSCYVESGLGGRSVYDSEIVNDRFLGAARAIRELDTWLALPMQDTATHMVRRVSDVANSLLSGLYHYLPYVEGSTEPIVERQAGASRYVIARATTRAILVAILPIVAYVAWRISGLGFPSGVDQWLGSLAILWMVLRTVQALDPSSASTLKDIRDVLPATPIRKE